MTRREKIVKGLLVGLCVCCLAGCGKSKETEEEQLKLRSQGMEQARAGEYEEAVASYDKALGLAGMHVGALELDIAAYKASALYHAGDLTQAIDTCTAVLDLKESRELYLTRGLMYREAGNVQAANEDFKKAMGMTSSKDLVMLGRLSYYMEDYAKAKEYLEKAPASEGKEETYWLAELYWQTGNQDYAIQLYQTYLEGDAVYLSAYSKVAGWQMEHDDYDAALSTVEAGIVKGNADNLQNLLGYEIAIYEQKGDFATAKMKMESYMESYPEDEEAAREYNFLRTR